ncbi:MAG: DUF6262 family protein [Nocardioides sp.]
MATDQALLLHAATQRRANTTRARAREALRRLNQQGASITYVPIAEAAGVSRSLLYRDPELRAEIDRLRNPTPTTAPRQPAAERMSQASHDELDAALRCEVKELRRENQALRNRLATTLGETRGTSHQTRP